MRFCSFFIINQPMNCNLTMNSLQTPQNALFQDILSKSSESMEDIQQKQTGLLKKNINKNRKWTFQQNILYVRFLRSYSKKFDVNDGDKKFRKYKRMSVYLVTKNPKQCRTHHQKMMLKFGNVQKIIEQLCFEQKSQKELSKKTENHEMFKASQARFQLQISGQIQDADKYDKLYPSYSSEFIFDILF